MVLPDFEYLCPKTIGEACNLLLELGPKAKVMAGATLLCPGPAIVLRIRGPPQAYRRYALYSVQ